MSRLTQSIDKYLALWRKVQLTKEHGISHWLDSITSHLSVMNWMKVFNEKCVQPTDTVHLLLYFMVAMRHKLATPALDHGALWKFNAGFRTVGLVSFIGLPPSSWSSKFRLIREDNSRPLSNYPVLLLCGPSQPLLALLKFRRGFTRGMRLA